jgi:capsular exopolysaccharide synthesis family protein
MEQLEKAVAKARAQRRIAQPGERRAPGENGTVFARPTPPVYRETPVVPFRPAAFEANKVVANRPDHPVADIYRSLRARVQQRLSRDNRRSLGITSPGEGEGKSWTAVNLALSLALDENQTVLLADLDLREPAVARYFGIEPKLGINDYLQGRATLPECMVNPGIDRLVLLPAVGSLGNSAELLSSPQMTSLARELKQRYVDRIIIYDLPPLLTVGDTIGFLPNVDATLLVLRDGKTHAGELRRAVELLAGHELIGTVLNAVH